MTTPPPLVLVVLRAGGVVGFVIGTVVLIAMEATVDQFWPVTIAGWLSFVLACTTFVGVGYHLIKNPSDRVGKDGEEKRAAMEKRLCERLDTIDRTLNRINEDTARRLVVWEARMRVVEDNATIAKVKSEHTEGDVREVRGMFDKQFEASEEHSRAVLKMMSHIAGGVRGMSPKDLRDDD